MKKQRYLRSCFVLLLLFTFSIPIFGCGDKRESKIQAEKVESKQRMEKNSAQVNEVEVVKVNASGSKSSQVFPVEDEIQLDEWMQLVKDIKSTLGEMEEVSKQVLQTSELR